MLGCDRLDAVEQAVGDCVAALLRQADGHEHRLGPRAHRRQVAQADGHGLVADRPRRTVGAEDEVDALGEHVDSDDRPPHRGRSQHGGIVAGGHLQPRVGGNAVEQPGNEFGFHGKHSIGQRKKAMDGFRPR